MKSASKLKSGAHAIDATVQGALDWLKAHSSTATRDGMARFAIPSDRAYGVSMKDINALGKELGRDQELATALWDTGVYEARMLASLVGDPAVITPAQMDRWCKAFDNWAVCDTMCFRLFDRTPHAWDMVDKWARRSREFEKRTGFALLWSLSVHDKRAGDSLFIERLALIEEASDDERNFVKKAVNMALRAIGKRNATLHAAAVELAGRLAKSESPTSRWIGKDALKELKSEAVVGRVAARTKGGK